MSTADRLAWSERLTNRLWLSTDGRYAIVRDELPEHRPKRTVTFTLRKIDPASSVAYPGTLGHFLAQEYTLAGAKQEAERDNFAEEHAAQLNVPPDLPAVGLRRFFWPISNGTTRAGLAIVREDGRYLARVYGTVRTGDGFEPGVFAELDLTGLGFTGTADNTTEHGPDPCYDCGVNPGTPHLDGCDIARCMFTGGQRLSCEQDDHDDCGRQVWTGRWPGEAEAEEFGWWVQDRCAEGLGWVPCAPGAPGACPDLNRLHLDARWDRTAGRWVRREEATR